MSRVGHRVVTQEDVDDWISRDPQTATRGATPEMRGEIAEKLQQNLKLLAAAEKQGFDQEKAYLRQRERAADELLAGLWMEKIRQTVTVTDQEKRAYYKRETNRFRTPIYGLSVIRTKDLAGIQKAQAMLKMGKPFGTVAKFLSVDPASKKRGGMLPPIAHAQLPPAMQTVLATLKVGSLIGPIPSGKGFELFRLDTLRLGPPAPYESVQAAIEQFLVQQKVQRKMAEKI